ncbi:NAD(P)/FAD-dependent oxidoreductase [Lysinibacillus xylanilyticus]|uniref:flavin-containing monooxygenase n=1 Tax=Lysinibacillus xylanilyticus TaxID=582475 RepID=UPI002B2412B2|nr:NAD(P)/FAD-dependent oxidoreductase [Lysinibacillus xylanilyticus]MEB2298566.1 NAD(P)/FAD-dependent oxidoreductase [Lysinibacillus xylanilyticus]
MLNIYNTIIIGGGQAGLAMGYYLKKSKHKFLILDAHIEVGDSWRIRYDSLQLFTPRSHSSLPGLALNGDQNGYPTKDEIANYLKDYQKKFELPISLESKVTKVTKKDGIFKISTIFKETYFCKNIIIATGPFQVPFIPKISDFVSSEVYQCHTVDYKNPSQLREGQALVIGGGNSGMQIAAELANSKKNVSLSISKNPKFFPYTVFNKSIFWWLSKFGILRFTINSKIGRKIKENDPIIGEEVKSLIKNKEIKVFPRAISVMKDKVSFEDGQSIHPKNIIWATGFKNDYSWIDVNKEIFDDNGYPIHKRGVTKEPGLYFIGLSWQYRRGSALLLGVGEDAEYLAETIVWRE